VSALVRRLPPWSITAGASVVYLIAAPPSPDLAAASYRSDLFGRVGFTLWDNSWYAGHHLPAYSLLAPALGALIGTQLLTALAMVAAAALFATLIEGRFSPRATRFAAAWFALGAAIALLSSRVPFDLGLALGLGALVLAQRGRTALAALATVLAAIASPVAAAFLALAYLAWRIANFDNARTQPIILFLSAAAPVAVLELAFPEGGSQPFVPSAFWPALVGVLALAVVVPRERRVLRIGLWLYALALIASFVTSTAVGGNADRLGALAAGPVAACLLGAGIEGRWRRWLLIAISPALLYWQANAPVADFASAIEDPATGAAYYRPLLGELQRLDIGYGHRPARIEVVATADHWEARFLAPHVPIARGWERQLDRYRNGLFYGPSSKPGASEYLAWLHAQAISYVALPDAPLDYSAKTEARLLESGPPAPLSEVWRSRHWRLFSVPAPTPLAQAPAQLTALSTDAFTLLAPKPGEYTVKIHYTPYWAVAAGALGCVSEAPGDWTRVRAERAGYLRIVIGFSLTRIFAHGARCA
jgi:MFS family permease